MIESGHGVSRSQYRRTHALAYFTKYNDNGFVDGFAFVDFIYFGMYTRVFLQA